MRSFLNEEFTDARTDGWTNRQTDKLTDARGTQCHDNSQLAFGQWSLTPGLVLEKVNPLPGNKIPCQN